MVSHKVSVFTLYSRFTRRSGLLRLEQDKTDEVVKKEDISSRNPGLGREGSGTRILGLRTVVEESPRVKWSSNSDLRRTEGFGPLNTESTDTESKVSK